MENHRNLHCFSPHIFLCKAIRNLSIQQDGKGTGCWLYLAVELLVAVVGNNSLASVYYAANFQRVDWWEIQLIPKNQNKTSFCSIWWEGEHKQTRRRCCTFAPLFFCWWFWYRISCWLRIIKNMGLKINRNEVIHRESSVISSAWPSKLQQLISFVTENLVSRRYVYGYVDIPKL